MRLEEIAVGKALRWRRVNPRGSQGNAGRVIDPDGLNDRCRCNQLGKCEIKVVLLCCELLVRLTGHQISRIIERIIDELERFDCLFLLNIKGADDALVGESVCGAIAKP
jgi:hypothetical protein